MFCLAAAALPPLALALPCGELYADGFADYSANSGAWLHSHARGEDPTEAWGHQAQNQGSMQNDLKVLKDMGGFGSPEAAELLVDIATNMVLSCWAMGGRFWAASLKQGGDSHVSGSATLCAPESCAQREVETEVVPFWFSKIMKGAQLASAAVQELGHWADLALDFLLIGVDGCGTTALRRGLARHRLINFTTFSIHGVDEDFFLHEMGRNTLPFAWQVQHFAQRREESLGGLIGLYQAVIWKEDVLLYILEKVPDVKLIATVCDPVDRFERLVDFAGRAGLSFEEALDQELKAADDFGQLLKWQAAFKDRLFFVERDALSAPETYDDLAAFLGLPGFRAQRFWRYNARGRREPKICNRTLLAQLKERFDFSYEVALHCLGSKASGRLQQRLSRCDQPVRESTSQRDCFKSRCDF